MTQPGAVAVGLAGGIAFVMLFGITFQIEHHVSIVRITQSTDSNLAFDPKSIKVLSGVNNTVKWINETDLPALLVADNESDPRFYNAAKDFVLILAHKSYEYTFTGVGAIGYHGRPSQSGSVVVLSALPSKR